MILTVNYLYANILLLQNIVFFFIEPEATKDKAKPTALKKGTVGNLYFVSMYTCNFTGCESVLIYFWNVCLLYQILS